MDAVLVTNPGQGHMDLAPEDEAEDKAEEDSSVAGGVISGPTSKSSGLSEVNVFSHEDTEDEGPSIPTTKSTPRGTTQGDSSTGMSTYLFSNPFHLISIFNIL